MTSVRLGLPRSEVPDAFDVGAARLRRDWSAQTPAITRTFEFRRGACGFPDDGRGLRLLDAGCGTGASTAALLAAAPEAEIVAVDASAGMLDAGQGKAVAVIGAVRAQPRSRISPTRVSTDRSTASSPRT